MVTVDKIMVGEIFKVLRGKCAIQSSADQLKFLHKFIFEDYVDVLLDKVKLLDVHDDDTRGFRGGYLMSFRSSILVL